MIAPRKTLWSTPQDAIDKIQTLLSPLQSEDIFYDVGCGDGRVIIHLAKTTPCRHFVGIEIDRDRADKARAAVRSANLDPSVIVEIRCENALASDYADATAVFLYLIPRGLRLIKPILLSGKQSVVALCEDGEVNKRQKGRWQLREELGEKLEQMDIEVSQKQISSSEVVLNECEEIGENSVPSDHDDGTMAVSNDGRPSLRVVTYMAGWGDIQHVAKDFCIVSHQKGAKWPIYLYHFN